MTPRALEEALRYLEGFVNYERRPDLPYNSRALNLDRVHRLLDALGRPQARFPAVHIAGTNGKGSVAALLESALRAAGYRTGLYTSPHLVCFRERIRLDGALIPEPLLLEGVGLLREAVESIDWKGLGRPTFFEAYTALGFWAFARAGVEVAVVEVGMGGRLDATRACEPLVSVITRIGYDHMDKLGHTLDLIAREKAGIAKRGVPVVVAPQEEEAMAAIREACGRAGAPLVEVPSDAFRLLSATLGRTEIELDLPALPRRLATRLAGDFQGENLAVSAVACAVLRGRGLCIPDGALVRGFEEAVWPGRIQVVPGSPVVILDGGHNPSATGPVAGFLTKVLGDRRVVLVLSISANKDIRRAAAPLLALASEVVFTRSSVPRAADPRALREALADIAPTSRVVEEPAAALDAALKAAGPEGVVLVAGSFFLVGDLIRLLPGAYPFA